MKPALMARFCAGNLVRRAVSAQRTRLAGTCILLVKASGDYRREHFPSDVEEEGSYYTDAQLQLNRNRVDATADLLIRVMRGYMPREGQAQFEHYQETGYYWPLLYRYQREREEAMQVAGRIVEAIERAEFMDLKD